MPETLGKAATSRIRSHEIAPLEPFADDSTRVPTIQSRLYVPKWTYSTLNWRTNIYGSSSSKPHATETGKAGAARRAEPSTTRDAETTSCECGNLRRLRAREPVPCHPRSDGLVAPELVGPNGARPPRPPLGVQPSRQDDPGETKASGDMPSFLLARTTWTERLASALAAVHPVLFAPACDPIAVTLPLGVEEVALAFAWHSFATRHVRTESSGIGRTRLIAVVLRAVISRADVSNIQRRMIRVGVSGAVQNRLPAIASGAAPCDCSSRAPCTVLIRRGLAAVGRQQRGKQRHTDRPHPCRRPRLRFHG
jgi:hypothetical protein